ncbi:hypothetical protein [uncultured Pontibacter sp.]|uniref:hypothetical protein n=1 Tax=uncultured Pontibacter sp. TaxID=453356 RepID=UPI00262689EA|nr:hypothetical protein [uncultured Pontibacter sp.]
MSNQIYRIQGLKGIRDLVKVTCEAHISVSEFKSGLSLEDEGTESMYPLAYLETGFDVRQEDGNSETYSINLNIADRMPEDATEEEVILTLSKTTQILDEIHYQLETLSPSSIKVGYTSKLVYRSYGKDNLAVTRAEFTIRIPRYVARKNSGLMSIDIPNLPKFGNAHIILWDSIKNKPELLSTDDLEAVSQHLNASIQTTRQALEDAIQVAKSDLEDNIGTVKSDLEGNINNVKSDLTGAKAEFNTRIVGAQTEFNARLEATKTELEDKILISSQTTETIGVTVDGGKLAIKSGSKGYREIPFAGKILSYTIIGPNTGDIIFDLKKATLETLESAVSICGNNRPMLQGQSQKLGTDLLGWDIQVNAGNVLEFFVESATLSKIQLFLNIKRD